MTNPYEAHNRTRKAEVIADVAIEAHAHLETSLDCLDWLRDLSTETQDVIAAFARNRAGLKPRKARPASADTWREVERIVERRTGAQLVLS